jgi:ADP-ribose pyrophosphatase YjhB (NUDIX family)
MTFQYQWHRKEANFGLPIEGEVAGGSHFTIENILKFEGRYVGLRRPMAVPGHEVPPRAVRAKRPMLYFVHDLPIWGESLDQYVSRIVHEQAGVEVKRFRVVDLTMNTYEDSQQWALTPYVLVELDRLPIVGKYGNEVSEVVTFTKETVPDDFGWYERDELRTLLSKL